MKKHFLKSLFSSLIFIIFLLTLTGCSKSLTPEERMGEIETRPIKSCVLSSNIEQYANGAFILGVSTYSSGSKTQVDYYVYVKGVEGYRLQKLDFNKVEIVETNEVEPSIKGYFSSIGKIYESPNDIEGFDSFIDNYKDFEKYTNYILYIPEGTIKEEFNLDLNNIIN